MRAAASKTLLLLKVHARIGSCSWACHSMLTKRHHQSQLERCAHECTDGILLVQNQMTKSGTHPLTTAVYTCDRCTTLTSRCAGGPCLQGGAPLPAARTRCPTGAAQICKSKAVLQTSYQKGLVCVHHAASPCFRDNDPTIQQLDMSVLQKHHPKDASRLLPLKESSTYGV